jgi:hypothetical protein
MNQEKSAIAKYCVAASIIILLLNLACSYILGLSEDGAHYALYATHLDWGYVDHPPLSGWLQAIVMHVFGGSNIAMHLSAFISSVFILVTTFFLAKEIYPERGCNFAYICVLASFMAAVFFALTIIILPQNPLRLFGLLSCLFYLRATKTHSPVYFILTGICLGLCGLSDFTAILIAIGLTIYTLAFERKLLRSAWLYVAVLIAIILVSPFIIWNMHNNYISFVTGSSRIVGQHWTHGNFLTSILRQILGYSPALITFSILGSIQAFKQQNKQQLILIIPGLLIVLLFFITGGWHKIDFHWPALGWALLLPAAVSYMLTNWQKIWVKILSFISLTLSVVLAVAFYNQVLITPLIKTKGRDVLYELRGWDQAAAHAIKLAHNIQPGVQPTLFVNHWAMASRLAWYSKQRVQISTPSNIAGYFQFKRWFGTPDAKSNGIMVTYKQWSQPNKISAQPGSFAHCDYIDQLPIKSGQQTISTFLFYHCWDYLSAVN